MMDFDIYHKNMCGEGISEVDTWYHVYLMADSSTSCNMELFITISRTCLM